MAAAVAPLKKKKKKKTEAINEDYSVSVRHVSSF